MPWPDLMKAGLQVTEFVSGMDSVTGELFDVCDADDRVIGHASRTEVHAQQLLHRAVHIWVWNSRAELLIHRRSGLKDEYPNCFTSSASGHVEVGEGYDAAAVRELKEELQLAGTLTTLVKLPASPDTAHEHTMLYRLISDDVPVPDPQEIAELYWLPEHVIDEMVIEKPEQFTPPFRELWRWWKNVQNERSA